MHSGDTVMQFRRPRLSVIQDSNCLGRQRFKDHITGEELNSHKILERINAGIYSRYHVLHLNLSAISGHCSVGSHWAISYLTESLNTL